MPDTVNTEIPFAVIIDDFFIGFQPNEQHLVMKFNAL